MKTAWPDDPAARRVNGVLGVLASHTVRALAKEMGVGETVLAHIRRGRLRVSERVAMAMEKAIGVSRIWLMYGEYGVFVEGRSPGAHVEWAVLRQTELGYPHGRCLPLLHDLDELALLGVDRVTSDSSPVAWHVLPRRESATRSGDFYLALSSAEANMVGGRPGDYLLFESTATYIRTIPCEGEHVVYIVADGDKARLSTGEWPHSVYSQSMREAMLKALRTIPARIDHEIQVGRTVYCRWRHAGGPALDRIHGVAVRLEREMRPFVGPG